MMHRMILGPMMQVIHCCLPWRPACLVGISVLLGSIGLSQRGTAQDVPSPLSGYLTFAQMEQALQELDGSRWAKLSSLGETRGKRTIWLLSVGADDAATRPAILVLGNVTGSHVLGRELAVRMARLIVRQAESEPEVAKWLQRYSIYFIPSPTPDATEKNFTFPVREHDGNGTPTDDDRDFESGEDPPRDLNQDGWITMMRVAEQFGDYRTHPSDPRVMIPVDDKKREVGQYRLLPESLDSDQDENFGEDASDGVDFNRNFPFNYPFFAKASGPHQVSESESRAVADFMFDHPEIAFVFCFSPENNLFYPWKGSEQSDAARIKSKVLTADQPHLDCLTDAYRKLHGGKDAPAASSGEGSFSEWSYFHYGRWTFSARGWWIPKVSARATPEAAKAEPEQAEPEQAEEDSKASEKPTESQATPTAEENGSPNEAPDQKPVAAEEAKTEETAKAADAKKPCEQQNQDKLDSDDKRGQELLNALAWFSEQGLSGFVDWTTFEHPGMPGKQVEIGGLKPLMLLNPPESLIEPLVKPHVDFLKVLVDNWPSIEIRDVKARQVGPGLFDIQCRIVNTGALPTMPEMGRINDQWFPIQVQLNGADGARWVNGSPRQSVGRLKERGGSQELRWVFMLPERQSSDSPESPEAQASPEFSVEAYAPTLHRIQVQVEVAEGSE